MNNNSKPAKFFTCLIAMVFAFCLLSACARKQSAFENSVNDFDIQFLKLENRKENKVYSPLSVRYALGMVREGACGNSKTQIDRVLPDFPLKKYTSNENMAFANYIFIKDTCGVVKKDYSVLLADKFNAEVKTDSFSSPETVNAMISDKTLGLIKNTFEDISQYDFLLVNALAIDLEWEHKFFDTGDLSQSSFVNYSHENFGWYLDPCPVPCAFENSEDISGLKFAASFNRYDIVKLLGEENIRRTVKEELEKYLAEHPEDSLIYYLPSDYRESANELSRNETMQIYLDKYIADLNSNYLNRNTSIDFSFYADENVKVFAKDLEECEGTKLQYIAIMPVGEDLDKYIENLRADDINRLTDGLKEAKIENCKDGVITKISGYMPKFKFDYELNLKNSLQKSGITDIFDRGKADLSNISDFPLYIGAAVHKSNIELTENGITAAAVSSFGGWGAGGAFDYIYEVPVEEIDLTFDRPFMFIIKDKVSDEVWFIGTVYSPLPYSREISR